MSETAWKVAREAAAEPAYDMATAYWDMPEGVDYTGEDLRSLSDRIRSLPMPPAFRAAVEAEMGELREIARQLAEGQITEIEERLSHHGDDMIDSGAARIAELRALLSRMEGKP